MYVVSRVGLQEDHLKKKDFYKCISGEFKSSFHQKNRPIFQRKTIKATEIEQKIRQLSSTT